MKGIYCWPTIMLSDSTMTANQDRAGEKNALGNSLVRGE